MQKMSQAAMLSAPAAPVSSKSLAEAKSRAHSFYRQVNREEGMDFGASAC